jgi:hypothetical protein
MKDLQIYGYPFEQPGCSNYEPLDNDGNVFRINQYGLKRSNRIKDINK